VTPAALGFTVKSGWTAAVLVAAGSGGAEVACIERVDISDPDVPESRQPYHEGFGTARGETAALKRLLASVERHGARSVASFIAAQQARFDVRRAGLVVGSLADPATIANHHIRIHALEGQLFRETVRKAVVGAGMECQVWRERDLWGQAARILGVAEPAIKTRMAGLSRPASGPWRAEQKAAAAAAMMLLAGDRR
jgi:hypothetical protein